MHYSVLALLALRVVYWLGRHHEIAFHGSMQQLQAVLNDC